MEIPKLDLNSSLDVNGTLFSCAHVGPLVAPSTTTAPTPVTASTSALASTPSTGVAATTTTTFTWPGFIDCDIAAHEILAVEGLDNAGRFFIVVDFDEGKPTRLSSLAVRH